MSEQGKKRMENSFRGALFQFGFEWQGVVCFLICVEAWNSLETQIAQTEED